MKIKNNTKNLIPRKQIGGLIPKFKEPADGIRRLGVYKGRSYGVDKNGSYMFLNTGQNVWQLVAKNKGNLKQQQPEIYNYFKNIIEPVNKPVNKPKTQNQGTQGKPAGTQGNGTKGGTRGSGTRGNARTTAKPAATTFTESPTNITDQAWLDARNAAMQRGWGTYNYNGQTYRFKGDEFQQAKRNWNNRRKVGYQAEGILDLNPPAEITAMIPRGDGEVKPEDAIIEKNTPIDTKTTPIDTKTTPYTFWYQQQLTNNPNLTRDMLWQATQDVRNGKRNASYYGESSNLVSQLANANQDSAKNYIYNLWNTNNDVATQAGRKNYTESQGLTFGEPTTLFSWLNDAQKFLNENKRFSKAKQGTKLIRRK